MPHLTSLRTLILVAAFAVGLTVIFWQPLWTGGGLIGGDTYTYYLPQKTFYADRLQAGEFPLWNNRVGHGYPVLGESQTGACYPSYLLAYSTLDVNTAYNAVHLLHYVFAFLFTWMYARRLGLRTMAALLAGVVFTYGWFPSRCCWEWAIVTGVSHTTGDAVGLVSLGGNRRTRRRAVAVEDRIDQLWNKPD